MIIVLIIILKIVDSRTAFLCLRDLINLMRMLSWVRVPIFPFAFFLSKSEYADTVCWIRKRFAFSLPPHRQDMRNEDRSCSNVNIFAAL